MSMARRAHLRFSCFLLALLPATFAGCDTTDDSVQLRGAAVACDGDDCDSAEIEPAVCNDAGLDDLETLSEESCAEGVCIKPLYSEDEANEYFDAFEDYCIDGEALTIGRLCNLKCGLQYAPLHIACLLHLPDQERVKECRKDVDAKQKKCIDDCNN